MEDKVSGAISFTDPAVQRCPFPTIKKMHEEQPVLQDPVTGFYVVAGFNDVTFVNEHPELFSNRTSVVLGIGGEPPEVTELYETQGIPRMHTLVTNDPPSHGKYRAIVDKVFAPSFVKSLEGYIEALANHMIDEFIDRGSADLLHEFCVRLPVFVIADQLGAPREDWKQFKTWSDVMIDLINPQLSDHERLALCREHIGFQNYLEEKRLEYRDLPPEPKLLSRLAHAEIDGRELNAMEFNSIAELLLVAGNETTASTFAHSIVELIRNPSLRVTLEQDYSQIPVFIEEILRQHSPSPHVYRLVMKDVQLSGVDIPKDSIVMISYLAANYDPIKYQNPDEIDLKRKGVRNHLTFGRGIHHCVGHLLARTELRIGIEQLLRRVKDLTFDPAYPEPAILDHFHIHTIDNLFVRFSPRSS